MTGEHWETHHGDVVEIWQGDNGFWHYRVQAPNGEIGDWGEAYTHRSDAVDAAERHHPRVDVPDE